MRKKIESEALASVHESAEALLAIGAIDKATMREFDQCRSRRSASAAT
jgi:putative transcriptional regulator